MSYHREGLDYSVLLQTFGITTIGSVCFDADELRKVMLATRKLDGNFMEGLKYGFYQLGMDIIS